MIKLKQVIHYPDTNSVEATWVNEITPAIEVHESQAPDTEGPDGEIVSGAITPAHTIPAVEVPVKCHSYADVQMDMLRAELGDDAPAYEELMALVESNIKPAPPPVLYPVSCSPWQMRKALNAQGLRQAVETTVAESDNQELKDGWEFATEFRSNDPFVISMGAALGKSEAETRQLIEFAATL